MIDTTGRATVLYRQSRGVGEEPQGSGDHSAGEAGKPDGRRRWYVVDMYSTRKGVVRELTEAGTVLRQRMINESTNNSEGGKGARGGGDG